MSRVMAIVGVEGAGRGYSSLPWMARACHESFLGLGIGAGLARKFRVYAHRLARCVVVLERDGLTLNY